MPVVQGDGSLAFEEYGGVKVGEVFWNADRTGETFVPATSDDPDKATKTVEEALNEIFDDARRKHTPIVRLTLKTLEYHGGNAWDDKNHESQIFCVYSRMSPTSTMHIETLQCSAFIPLWAGENAAYKGIAKVNFSILRINGVISSAPAQFAQIVIPA